LQEKGALASSCKVERITFNAVTPVAVQEAMQQPRCISQGLVNAYFARISMDYLLGFHMSPILWRKLPGCSSAGRVQSPALRLLCDREMERDLFKPEKYYSMSAALQPRGSDPQVLTLTSIAFPAAPDMTEAALEPWRSIRIAAAHMSIPHMPWV
jgi:DNA topoisomerase-1